REAARVEVPGGNRNVQVSWFAGNQIHSAIHTPVVVQAQILCGGWRCRLGASEQRRRDTASQRRPNALSCVSHWRTAGKHDITLHEELAAATRGCSRRQSRISALAAATPRRRSVKTAGATDAARCLR